MKSLLLFSLICVSGLSFSAQAASKSNVIEAISHSLKSHVLNCKESQNQYKSSKLNIQDLNSSVYKMSHLRGNPLLIKKGQSIISFEGESDGERLELLFFINDESSIVDKVKISILEETIEKINRGTLSKPRFESEKVLNKNLAVECK